MSERVLVERLNEALGRPAVRRLRCRPATPPMTVARGAETAQFCADLQDFRCLPVHGIRRAAC